MPSPVRGPQKGESISSLTYADCGVGEWQAAMRTDAPKRTCRQGNGQSGRCQQSLGKSDSHGSGTPSKQHTHASHFTVCHFRAQSLIFQYPVLLTVTCLISQTAKSETVSPHPRNCLVEGKYVQGHFKIHAFKHAEAASMIWRMERQEQDYHPLGDLTHFTSEASYLGHLSDQLHFCHRHQYFHQMNQD